MTISAWIVRLLPALATGFLVAFLTHRFLTWIAGFSAYPGIREWAFAGGKLTVLATAIAGVVAAAVVAAVTGTRAATE